MTAVTVLINILLPTLAGVCILLALFFIFRAVSARAKVERKTYGVGRQEARQSMKLDFIRALAVVIVGLIFLSAWGILQVQSSEISPMVTDTPDATQPATQPASATPALTTATPTPPSMSTSTPSPTLPAAASPTPEPSPTLTPQPPTAVVNSGVGVWLRALPGTEGEQVERVLEGAELVLLPGREQGPEFEWQQVRTPAGNEGWVAVPFITYNQ